MRVMYTFDGFPISEREREKRRGKEKRRNNRVRE